MLTIAGNVFWTGQNIAIFQKLLQLAIRTDVVQCDCWLIKVNCLTIRPRQVSLRQRCILRIVNNRDISVLYDWRIDHVDTLIRCRVGYGLTGNHRRTCLIARHLRNGALWPGCRCPGTIAAAARYQISSGGPRDLHCLRHDLRSRWQFQINSPRHVGIFFTGCFLVLQMNLILLDSCTINVSCRQTV